MSEPPQGASSTELVSSGAAGCSRAPQAVGLASSAAASALPARPAEGRTARAPSRAPIDTRPLRGLLDGASAGFRSLGTHLKDTR
eukprot:4698318-Lingulodinium_polyedra.AAC.1